MDRPWDDPKVPGNIWRRAKTPARVQPLAPCISQPLSCLLKESGVVYTEIKIKAVTVNEVSEESEIKYMEERETLQ